MMFSAIRKRMSYANVTATLALFFAMSGGALAASHYLLTSTKQISPKVLKSLQGRVGASGAPGAQGPAGAVGAQGPAGPAGAKGETGSPGAPGVNGESVTSKMVSKASETCTKQGGSEFKAGSTTTLACNGKEGSPWAAGGTLPVGATETGTVVDPRFSEPEVEHILVPISFPIPLATELDSNHVEVVKLGATGTNCTGTPATPTAPSGFLCVYMSHEPEAGDVSTYEIFNALKSANGASTAGTIFFAILIGTTESEYFAGTWAVTG